MANALVRPSTYHDYRELPEGGSRYQLIDGELHMSPSPNLFHQILVGNIHFLISSFLRQHPIGKVLCAPIDVYLTETNVYQPDLVYIANDNASIMQEDGIHGAPDLVVEILSPATRKFDQGLKKRTYARCGVREYWIVDPETERIEVYHFEKSAEEPAATHRKNTSFETILMPGLSVAANMVFDSKGK
jgi:Uma2 family endonuclease